MTNGNISITQEDGVRYDKSILFYSAIIISGILSCIYGAIVLYGTIYSAISFNHPFIEQLSLIIICLFFYLISIAFVNSFHFLIWKSFIYLPNLLLNYWRKNTL